MTDNIDETLLINDWTPGHLATITPSTIMPQSMIPTEYSISFLIYLNNIDDTDPNKEQIIFIKGQKNNSELTLSIKPLRYNPYSDLRFTSKLQINVECTPRDKLLNNVCTGAGDGGGGDGDEDKEGGEQFTNTSSNSNRVHNKIGSNVVDYFTVQNIYSKETFTSISKETFEGGDEEKPKDKKDEIKKKKNEIKADILKIEELLTLIDKIVEEGKLTQFKEDAANAKKNVITLGDLQQIVKDSKNGVNLDKLIKDLTDAKGITDTAIKDITSILNNMSGSTKNEDYVELPNTSTQKISHICLVMRENIIDVYKNGLLESSKVLDSIPVINDGKFTFFPDLNKGFNGYINKFTYFNKGLNHNEVTENYDKMIKIIENTTRSELQN